MTRQFQPTPQAAQSEYAPPPHPTSGRTSLGEGSMNAPPSGGAIFEKRPPPNYEFYGDDFAVILALPVPRM